MPWPASRRPRGWWTRFPRPAAIPWNSWNPPFTACSSSTPSSVDDVFGGIAGVKLGLHNLSNLLASRKAQENRDLVRYVFSMLYLERKFAADPDMMSVVRSRLEHTSFRAEHFASHVNELCHSISGIYQDTLSKLKFRIKVSGSAQHLQDTRNADIIRALLLAGIRSAFLWRQLGGRRWKLLLQRKSCWKPPRTCPAAWAWCKIASFIFGEIHGPVSTQRSLPHRWPLRQQDSGPARVFSEFGLIKRRVLVEVRWLQCLADHQDIEEVPALSATPIACWNRSWTISVRWMPGGSRISRPPPTTM